MSKMMSLIKAKTKKDGDERTTFSSSPSFDLGVGRSDENTSDRGGGETGWGNNPRL